MIMLFQDKLKKHQLNYLNLKSFLYDSSIEGARIRTEFLCICSCICSCSKWIKIFRYSMFWQQTIDLLFKEKHKWTIVVAEEYQKPDGVLKFDCSPWDGWTAPSSCLSPSSSLHHNQNWSGKCHWRNIIKVNWP